MKIAGFLLLPSGWLIAVTAVVLLKTPPSQSAFVLAGIGVEAIGLVLLMRANRVPHREKR